MNRVRRTVHYSSSTTAPTVAVAPAVFGHQQERETHTQHIINDDFESVYEDWRLTHLTNNKRTHASHHQILIHSAHSVRHSSSAHHGSHLGSLLLLQVLTHQGRVSSKSRILASLKLILLRHALLVLSLTTILVLVALSSAEKQLHLHCRIHDCSTKSALGTGFGLIEWLKWSVVCSDALIVAILFMLSPSWFKRLVDYN